MAQSKTQKGAVAAGDGAVVGGWLMAMLSLGRV